MAKLLILNPNLDTFGRQSIPTSLISGLLKANSHSVELFDTTFLDIKDFFQIEDNTHEEVFLKLKVFKEVNFSHLNLHKNKCNLIDLIQKKVDSYNPDFIAFSFWGCHLHGEGEFHAFFHGLKIIESLDTKGKPIVVGGTVPTWGTEEALKHPKINYVVRGEGELVYLDIANRLGKGKSLSGIPNLWIDKGNGEIEKNELRPLIDPLDQLPHADFDIYDTKTFYRPYHGKMKRCLDYELTRGCFHKCSFCLSPFQRNVYGSPKNFRREKSISKIISEISYLKERYKLDLIRYQDETFLSMKPNKLKELAEEYAKHVDLPFMIEATVTSVTDDKLDSLQKMGCLSIGLGIESGSAYIRDNVVNKPKFSNKEALEKIKLIREKGMSVTLYNIIGYPGETKEMVYETLDLNYMAGPVYKGLAYFQPLEGTQLRTESISQGMLSEDSQGLENSSGDFATIALKDPGMPKEELEHYHDFFSYYVNVNKLFWPIIKYAVGPGFFSKTINLILTGYLNIRFKLLK